MTLLLNNERIRVLLIALATITTRIIYLVSPAGQLGDADEAVFGMMAQEIAALREFPIYCWQAQYAGAPVSYFAAIIFYFFGSGFVQLHLAMLPAAFFTPILFYFIYRRMFSSVEALVGALFLVFWPFSGLTLYNGSTWRIWRNLSWHCLDYPGELENTRK